MKKETSIFIFVLCLAAITVVFSALHGMNSDHTIFYEAGLRHLFGQVPYKDFYVPQGALTGFMFFPFLLITPTGGFALILASALVNMAATGVIWAIVKTVTGRVFYAFAGALLTAIWFLPVMGSFYCDHLAYLFVLVAVIVFLKLGWSWSGTLIAAVFFVLSYHTKQTVGVGAMAAFLVAALAVWGKRLVSWDLVGRFLAAYLVFHLLSLGIIAYFGEFGQYYRYSVSGPMFHVVQGHGKNIWGFIITLVMPWNINPYLMVKDFGLGRLIFYPVVLAVYCSYGILIHAFLKRKSNDISQRTIFTLFFLLLSLYSRERKEETH